MGYDGVFSGLWNYFDGLFLGAGLSERANREKSKGKEKILSEKRKCKRLYVRGRVFCLVSGTTVKF